MVQLFLYRIRERWNIGKVKSKPAAKSTAASKGLKIEKSRCEKRKNKSPGHGIFSNNIRILPTLF